MLITLQFGTMEGEGGTFALYQGLFPREETDDDDDRTLTGDSAMLRASSRRSSAEKLAPIKWFLLPWVCYLPNHLRVWYSSLLPIRHSSERLLLSPMVFSLLLYQ